MDKTPISSTDAPNAIGPYSAGMSVQGAQEICYFSGQIALPAGEGGSLIGSTAAAQTEQIMKNISALLAARDMSFSNIVKTTIFLKSMGDFKAVNEMYAKHFNSEPPARATIEVAGLPLDALVEIECVAAR